MSTVGQRLKHTLVGATLKTDSAVCLQLTGSTAAASCLWVTGVDPSYECGCAIGGSVDMQGVDELGAEKIGVEMW